ncbi:MAG: SIS domain-containing protein, partial [Microgenomates group bacterium]
MCGIFAYLGASNATKIVFNGLQDLQYRGYDSWGIASLTDHSLSVSKNIGALPNELSNYVTSHLAIGHTRWATHGGVTKNNAHPHLSCDGRFAVVHNGIIENFESLKNNLKNKHNFKSNTDTELIAHYLEENIKGNDPFSVFQSLVSQLIGHSAIVVLDLVQSDLYIYRSGSPLVLGKNGDELYVSSDLPSLTKYAQDIYPIKDGEIIKLSALPTTLSWTKVAANHNIVGKIKTKYHMETEIGESLSIVSNTFHFNPSKLKLISESIYSSKQILLVGCGSSYHACLYGMTLLQQLGFSAQAVIASEGESVQHTVGSDTLVIALSQSGETIDTLDFVNTLRGRGAKIISLSNVQYSTLDRLADLSLDLSCGKEVAVASTKAYIAMLLFFVELSLHMSSKADLDRPKYQ